VSRTYETDEHFFGAGVIPLTAAVAAATSGTGPWSVTVVGSGAVIKTYADDQNGSDGAVNIGLQATSEVQNICLHWGDVLSLDITHLQFVEFRLAVITALGTTATTTQFAFGLASERNDTIDTIAEAILFRCLGSTAVVVETDDGSAEKNDVATGVTLAVADGYKTFKIDFTKGLDNVQFHMDDSRGNNNRIAASTTFDMSNYTGNVQPFLQIQKAANTDVGTVSIDRFTMAWGEPVRSTP